MLLKLLLKITSAVGSQDSGYLEGRVGAPTGRERKGGLLGDGHTLSLICLLVTKVCSLCDNSLCALFCAFIILE